MNKPGEKILEDVAPTRDIEGLRISDGWSIRNVAHAEQRDTLRLPRGGAHEASLVAVKKFYDGSGGGEPGHYAMLFVEFRATSSRWRLVGVKVRSEEAARLAKHMAMYVESMPAKNERQRVGGKVIATESFLRGAPTADGFTVYVQSRMRDGEWGRTRGTEILHEEIPTVVAFLRGLAVLKSKNDH